MSAPTAPVFNDNPFKIGFFSPNCSGGMSPTTIPERWASTMANNIALARLADAAGCEFLLPIARWIGYGGKTDFHGRVLETITWATAMLAHTRYMNVFATIHTAFNHPVVVAKQIATMDELSGGRAGLNVVCGWNKPEYEALGVALPQDHATRYAYGEEWFDIVRRLWTTEGPFDYSGRFFTLKGVYGNPRPLRGIPPILNAAGSKEGREFATRNANFLFTPAIDLGRSRDEVAALKQQARDGGRGVEVLTFSHVVCRATTREAEEYLHWYARENADEEAVDNLIRLMFEHAESFPHDLLKLIRDRMAAGHGGYPLTGDPDTVADGIRRLHETGFAGTTLSFVDYVREFPYFRDEVMPRLERLGLRHPFKGHSESAPLP